MEQNHMIIILIKDTPQLAAGYLLKYWINGNAHYD